MMPDVKLHTVEPIVTPDKTEYGVNRMRVPGGWLYWLQPSGGAVVSSFVPDPLEAGARPLPDAIVSDEV